MSTKDSMITDISAELEKEFGAPGTPERAKFDEEAYTFYTSQILAEARKEAKMTQAELAQRVGTNKSYISKIEHGIKHIQTEITHKVTIDGISQRLEILIRVPNQFIRLRFIDSP